MGGPALSAATSPSGISRWVERESVVVGFDAFGSESPPEHAAIAERGDERGTRPRLQCGGGGIAALTT